MLFHAFEALVVVGLGLYASVIYLHALQASRYQLTSYGQWMRRNTDRVLRYHVIYGVVIALLGWYLPMLMSMFVAVEKTRNLISNWIVLSLFSALSMAFTLHQRGETDKKPFVLTARARRLMIVTGLILLIIVTGLELLHVQPYLGYAAIPYFVWVSGILMDPFEKRINAGFFQQAQRKLKSRKDLTVIGIAGSYGKTLTKFILREILSTKYSVLATPASFNTAMGISRVVNDSLEDGHEVFIAELGALHVGDIKHLVRLTHPKYGVITCIGPSHLESFGSMANIVDTMNELTAGIPEDGSMFFAADSGYSDRLYAACQREKFLVAVEQEGSFNLRVTDISFDEKGSHFALVTEDGSEYPCRTQLLGRTNLQNIALAAEVARKMGMSMEEIRHAIAGLPQFERRMQLITGTRFVIDDSANNTLTATADSLNVLADFPGKRFVVTPGLIENGQNADTEDANYAFGTQMGGCVDVVILVGARDKVEAIRQGAMKSGVPKSMIRVVPDLEAADDLIDEISDPGDSILYEGGAQA